MLGKDRMLQTQSHMWAVLSMTRKKKGGEKGRLIDWKTEPASIIKVQPPASPPSPIN